MKFNNGNHADLILSGNIPGSSDTNTVTFTSVSGKADSVVIGYESIKAMVLSDVSHLQFKDITIGGISVKNQVSVDMNGYIENVLFHHCNLYVDTSVNRNWSVVMYYNPNGNADSLYLSKVRFIGNEMRGGYQGFYFSYTGGTSGKNCMTTAAKRASVRIDSNRIYGQTSYSISFTNCAYIESVSYNLIEASCAWGILFRNGCQWLDSMVCNRIHLNSEYGGIQWNYINDKSVFGNGIAPALVANNEVICTGNRAYGMWTNHVHANIINNSIC